MEGTSCDWPVQARPRFINDAPSYCVDCNQEHGYCLCEHCSDCGESAPKLARDYWCGPCWQYRQDHPEEEEGAGTIADPGVES